MMTPRKLTVLIADDSAGVRESIRSTLLAAGHEAIAMATGREVLAALAERRFDALVTDLWMTGMDGIEVLKQAQRAYPDLRLIAITGGGPGMSIETAAALAQTWRAEKVFLKPFDERELVAHLESEAERGA
jgi:DNA-binding NtrC family response regulator